MKRIALFILAASALSAAVASVQDHDQYVGFCSAYLLIKSTAAKSDSAYAASIMEKSRNKQASQVAARFYINNFRDDVGKSVLVGQRACASLGVAVK